MATATMTDTTMADVTDSIPKPNRLYAIPTLKIASGRTNKYFPDP
jgi:hypothetical protein